MSAELAPGPSAHWGRAAEATESPSLETHPALPPRQARRATIMSLRVLGDVAERRPAQKLELSGAGGRRDRSIDQLGLGSLACRRCCRR